MSFRSWIRGYSSPQGLVLEEASGVIMHPQKTIVVDGGAIRFFQEGGMLSGKTERTLLIRHITSVEVIAPGWFSKGSIRFLTAGDSANNPGELVRAFSGDPRSDDYMLEIDRSGHEMAVKIKQYVENYK